MKRELMVLLPVAILVATVCFIVDCTPFTSGLESQVLAPKTTYALGAVLRGLKLPDDVMRCTVTAACSGLRTMVACVAVVAFLRKWRLIPVAIAGGFLLNLIRVVVVELLCRVDLSLGMMVHDLALFLVVAPVGVLTVVVYHRLTRPMQWVAQCYAMMLSFCFLIG